MVALHNRLASGFRKSPHFRGKCHIGVAIGNILINTRQDQDCISTVKMKDGSLMVLDARSRTERWAYWTGLYDVAVMTKLARLFTPGFAVLDVGANVGFYSIAWGRELEKVRGKLYAFEPVRNNFNRVQQAISLNSLQDTVQVFSTGLGDEEIEIPIVIEQMNNAQTGNAVIAYGEIKVVEGDCSERIKLVTLDSFVEREPIERCDLIKIDIEGAEVMFLKGGMNFLTRHRPIIYGEFNAYCMERFGYSLQDMVQLLKPLNYRFLREVGRNADFVEIQDFNEPIENILIVPKDVSDGKLREIGILALT
jgi:FkbM family methyltransferase